MLLRAVYTPLMPFLHPCLRVYTSTCLHTTPRLRVYASTCLHLAARTHPLSIHVPNTPGGLFVGGSAFRSYSPRTLAPRTELAQGLRFRTGSHLPPTCHSKTPSTPTRRAPARSYAPSATARGTWVASNLKSPVAAPGEALRPLTHAAVRLRRIRRYL